MNGISSLGMIQSAIPAQSRPDISTDEQLRMAGEFESVFVSMLLKSMRESTSEEGLFGSDSTDSMGAMFDLYMSKHLAGGDHFGVRRMMMEYMKGASDNESQ